MVAPTRENLVEILDAPMGAIGLDLEDLTLSNAGKRSVLRVAVDKDGGVSLDEVAEATREVSRVLDESDVMGAAPYTLEVGSPGVDHPLTLPRHWRRNHDRLVKVTLRGEEGSEGETLTGRITSSDDDSAALDVDGEERAVPLTDVVAARVQVEFNRKDG